MQDRTDGDMNANTQYQADSCFLFTKAELIIIVWHGGGGVLPAASGHKDHQTELEYIKNVSFHSWAKGFREDT